MIDWLISGSSKATLCCRKGILDKETEGLLQQANRMDDKAFMQIETVTSCSTHKIDQQETDG